MGPEQRPTRGRPRSAETDEKIVHSAQALLREAGPSGVTLAAVAAHSGVARTTIYRRYHDRGELLTAALRQIVDQGQPPEGLGVRDKVQWVLERTEEVLVHGVGPGAVASLLAGTDPEFGSSLRRSLDIGLSPVRAQIEADVEDGTLVDADPTLLLDLIMGACLAQALRSGGTTRRRRTETAELLARLLRP